MWNKLEMAIIDSLKSERKFSFLVGAGLSAASGIPTFRGKDGFWKYGSKNYMPQEIGTKRMFNVNSDAVWSWYLYRKTLCNSAKPNAGHKALKRIEEQINQRFNLITQNVDGLHKAVNQTSNRTIYIHGDMDFVRCSEECSTTLYPFPNQIANKEKGELISEFDKEFLECPKCGEDLRPHVLWFDENYDETYYKFQTAQSELDKTQILFLVGTSGGTQFPIHAIDRVKFFNGYIVDLNIADSQYSADLLNYENSIILREKSEIALPKIEEIISKQIFII